MSTCPTHLSEFSNVCAVMSRAFQLQMKWPERKSAVSLEPWLGRELSFRIEHFLEIHDTPSSFEAEEGHWAISCAVQFRTGTWNVYSTPCGVYNDTADETQAETSPSKSQDRDLRKHEDLRGCCGFQLQRKQGLKTGKIESVWRNTRASSQTALLVNTKLEVVIPPKEGSI